MRLRTPEKSLMYAEARHPKSPMCAEVHQRKPSHMRMWTQGTGVAEGVGGKRDTESPMKNHSGGNPCGIACVCRGGGAESGHFDPISQFPYYHTSVEWWIGLRGT